MTAKTLSEIREPKISELGGKGYSLAVLINNGFNVPKGFVINSETFFDFLRDNNIMKITEKLASEINQDNFRKKSYEIKELILNAKAQEKISQEIRKSLSKLNTQYVSVRSSAVSEDSSRASFAGLHDTFLNIRAESDLVLENTQKCWASLFNERAVIYRTKKNIPHLEGIAVVVQEMLNPEISGITFTVHPTAEKSLLVEASYGIGDLVASGKICPDDFVVDRETLEIVEKRLGNKNRMSICKGERIEVVEIKKELIERQVIPDEKIHEIAKTCLEIEKIWGYPQDIEWCIYNNGTWLLQSRPITRI